MNRSLMNHLALPLTLTIALGASIPAVAFGAPGDDAAAKTEVGLPTGAEIFARFIEARGGEETLRRHTSRHVQGEVEDLYAHRIGTFDMKSAAPNLMVMTVDFPDESHVAGNDGKQTWRIDPIVGPMVYGSARTVDSVHFDFHAELNYSKHFPLIETIDTSTVDGVECYRVRVEGERGNERVEYYEVESGFRRAIETPFRTNDGVKLQFEIASNWEEIDSEWVATRHITKIIEPGGNEKTVQIVNYTDIAFNTLNDEHFVMPEKVKEKLAMDEAKRANEKEAGHEGNDDGPGEHDDHDQ